jgi:peptidoglycan/xylan/chitin deacetylase (PgdA/CDA1 family)
MAGNMHAGGPRAAETFEGPVAVAMRRAQTVCSVLAGGLLVVSGAVIWTAPEWLLQRLTRWYPGCLYQVATDEPLVALTIDDGPDPASTPLILTELRRQDSRATFFLITDRLRGQEALVRRLVEEGHELGNHFTRDRPSIRLSLPAFEADLLQAHQELAPWGRPRWARPGSGWYSQTMIGVLQRHGYRCALGSIYPFDTTIPSAVWATGYILRNVRPGAIIVLHDGGSRGRRTARVLAEVLPELRRRGYRVVSLSELVAAA